MGGVLDDTGLLVVALSLFVLIRQCQAPGQITKMFVHDDLPRLFYCVIEYTW